MQPCLKLLGSQTSVLEEHSLLWFVPSLPVVPTAFTMSQARTDAFAVFSGDKVSQSHVDMMPEALREAMYARGHADPGYWQATRVRVCTSLISSTISSSLSPTLYGEVSSSINQASQELKGDVRATPDFGVSPKTTLKSGGEVAERTQFESESALSAVSVVPVEVSTISRDEYAVSELVQSVSAQGDDSAQFSTRFCCNSSHMCTCRFAHIQNIQHKLTLSQGSQKVLACSTPVQPVPATPEDLSHHPMEVVQEGFYGMVSV